MKRSIILAAILTLAMSANAQWFDFSNNNGRFDIGLQLGQTGIGTDFTRFGGGISADVYGVHLDFLGSGPMYKYDNHVDVGPTAQVPDSTVLNINFGYQIPVLPWFRVMPIIGHCHTTHGYTDFSTVNVEVDDDYSAQIYHDYVRQGPARHYLNYGCGLVIQPVKWVSIYGVYTTCSIYGGVSLNISAFYDND